MKGFTLIEVLVVILIVGILSAIAIPAYLESMERTYAANGVIMVNTVGTANRMFAVNHGNRYVYGDFDPNNGCGVGVCPTNPPFDNSCILVWCKYLADRDFSSAKYCVAACDANANGSCNGAAVGNFAAGTHNRSGAAPYSDWTYAQDATGVITGYNGAPAPTY